MTEVADTRNSAVASTGWRKNFSRYVGTKFVLLLFGIILQIVLVKSMTLSNYIAFVVFFSVISFGGSMLNFGINRTIFKFSPILRINGNSSLPFCIAMVSLRL